MQTYKLINKITQALKSKDCGNAVIYDIALNTRKESILNVISSQAQLHTDQIDYVLKQRLVTGSSTTLRLAVFALGLILLPQLSGIAYGFLAVATVLMGVTLVINIYKSTKLEKTGDKLISRMNNEKEAHLAAMEEFDAISQFQLDTESAMSNMYEQYYAQNNNTESTEESA